ncbi:MAG: hypothetical protein ACOYL5_04040 [Phototrophicaceae bacterium]|jgi:hypothetical protein
MNTPQYKQAKHLHDTLPLWLQRLLDRRAFTITAPDDPETLIRRLNELHQPRWRSFQRLNWRSFQWRRLDVQIGYLDEDTALFCLRRTSRTRGSVDAEEAIAYGTLEHQPGKHGTAVTGYLRLGITTPLVLFVYNVAIIFITWAETGVTEVSYVYPGVLLMLFFTFVLPTWFLLQDYYALRRIIEGLGA